MFTLPIIGKTRDPLLGVLLVFYVLSSGSFPFDTPKGEKIESGSYAADAVFTVAGSSDIPNGKFKHDAGADISVAGPSCFLRPARPSRGESSRRFALQCVCTITSRAPPDTNPIL